MCILPFFNWQRGASECHHEAVSAYQSMARNEVFVAPKQETRDKKLFADFNPTVNRAEALKPLNKFRLKAAPLDEFEHGHDVYVTDVIYEL
mmetsp:Transcript_65516/g.131783  ORF Transcript_65516/g.131783 Transcript_65516/m.131783 type:complete len:91 (+) Transcript_65516:2120-2392(+)